MRFSARTGWDLQENALAALLRERRECGARLLDLTVSSPAACGITPDFQDVSGAFLSLAGSVYEPDPLGSQAAREAVSAYYADHGADVGTDQLCLTSSTSEAYSYLFRLLCDPADEVLIARPSYPLFDFIAQLDDVRLIEYPLLYEHGWHIDFESVRRAITPRTRALVIVHPNNPTGNFASSAERAALIELCAAHKLALIVDEVFLDFGFADERPVSFAATHSDALTFVLSGLSKVCALPQMKVSWAAVLGPRDLMTAAMARLEVIADTFLSVNSPAQAAMPLWLGQRHSLQQRIRSRLRENLAYLDSVMEQSLATRLQVQAGWTAMLRVPRLVEHLPFAEAALRAGVLVQPGDFYGASGGHVVLSLLTPPDVLKEGLAALPVR